MFTSPHSFYSNLYTEGGADYCGNCVKKSKNYLHGGARNEYA